MDTDPITQQPTQMTKPVRDTVNMRMLISFLIFGLSGWWAVSFLQSGPVGMEGMGIVFPGFLFVLSFFSTLILASMNIQRRLSKIILVGMVLVLGATIAGYFTTMPPR